MFGAAFALIGGLWFLATSLTVVRTQVVFDRPEREVRLHHRSLWGKGHVTFALSDVTAMIRGPNGDTFPYALLLRDGMHHPLTPSFTNTRRPHSTTQRSSDWLDSAQARD